MPLWRIECRDLKTKTITKQALMYSFSLEVERLCPAHGRRKRYQAIIVVCHIAAMQGSRDGRSGYFIFIKRRFSLWRGARRLITFIIVSSSVYCSILFQPYCCIATYQVVIKDYGIPWYGTRECSRVETIDICTPVHIPIFHIVNFDLVTFAREIHIYIVFGFVYVFTFSITL